MKKVILFIFIPFLLSLYGCDKEESKKLENLNTEKEKKEKLNKKIEINVINDETPFSQP